MGAAASISGPHDPRVTQIRDLLQESTNVDGDAVLMSKLKELLAGAERDEVPDQAGSAHANITTESSAQELIKSTTSNNGDAEAGATNCTDGDVSAEPKDVTGDESTPSPTSTSAVEATETTEAEAATEA